MPFLKRFYQHFLKILLIPLFVGIILLFFFESPVLNGFILGTTVSIILLGNWFYHLEKAKQEDENRVKTGTITRVIIVIVACLVWYRFMAYINIFGMIVGLSFTYILMMYRAIKEMRK
ncbi:ATP synthase subunit I [Aliicoccus persicus]|uniref:ATP synthase protein I n=1 Tax=Aliicoccus persicus TaxID=930138 RepID=A0A662Z647_9STAP|nr:ATP synthase subunit I [Aliicoccus persicus]SEW08368.1 ATP synthase protein I [Aliicoccus persicus]